MKSTSGHRWLDYLADEDVVFLRRFLLASGSLKQLCEVYGVSYPTIRLRLDRLIEKVKLVESFDQADDFELSLRAELVGGKIDAETFRRLLDAYRQSQEKERKIV